MVVTNKNLIMTAELKMAVHGQKLRPIYWYDWSLYGKIRNFEKC